MNAPNTNPKSSRVAVLGLYSSGSSATAGVLHHLGVRMGTRFRDPHFEASELANLVCQWWNEPELVETVRRCVRINGLRSWMNRMETSGANWIGAKHPLLVLSAHDLISAWGNDTHFIRTWRPIEESIASLARRGWWPDRRVEMQHRLWESANEFFSTQQHHRIEFSSLLESPSHEVHRLIEALGLSPSAKQIQTAIDFVRPQVGADR